MAFSTFTIYSRNLPFLSSLHRDRPSPSSYPVSLAIANPNKPALPLCLAVNERRSSSTSTSTSSSNKTKKKKRKKDKDNLSDFEIVGNVALDDDDDVASSSTSESRNSSTSYHSTPLPNPPAGFVVDDQGKVVMVSNKRIVTIVDSTNNYPLECVIRRVFRSSQGDECMLLCPVDTPVQILKSTNVVGWSAVSDEEVEAILPNVAFALAKIHMHLVYSGFCYTARGGFCYSEDDIFDFRTDNGQDVDGLPSEGVEITCFNLDGAHYMIYTPSDPLLFVVVKDQNGLLQIADDDLLDDPAIISAIDEETEFNALVEEEAALLDSLLGKT
ncbi:hypothetical protein HS088_TW02G00751 [Tripterygium wilfordii]|uniref:Uncharacterized protein n=1 Tax=Tripterygium wilfordii TaxID=458696 RepID=A0A7J7DZW3_TRIWF|nr:uncharacterized protein LOC120007551 [Tripterygium wilfordii]KAF5751734.1 hypothetical protein HS088_TW02G00751 [Tripterygium wilfordii]